MTYNKEEPEEISWNEATESSHFVNLKTEKEKIIVFSNWKLQRRPKDAKVGAGKPEIVLEVLEEDGDEVEKVFNSSSRRLLEKLKPILTDKMKGKPVKLSILRMGSQFDTQYSVKDILIKLPEETVA